MNIIQLSSFFGTIMIGEPHGDVLGLMNPYIIATSFTYFSSMMDFLYIQMLGNDEFDNN